MPLAAGSFIPDAQMRIMAVAAATTVALLGFGAMGASLGGASMVKGALRVLVGGWLAMVVTFGIGYAFNVAPA
jgi:VIT1/CCC1 family predicted Fe2+/Mn2+ transporter